MTPKQREALAAYEQYGSERKAAKALGVPRSTFKHHLAAARRWADMPEGVSGALHDTGLTDPNALHSGWLKTDAASIYFKMPQQDAAITAAEEIRDIFNELTPCPPIQPLDVSRDDTLTIYPVFDAHIGMKSWGEETGEDYDTDIAKRRIIDGMSKCVASAPPSREAIVLVGGDLLHANDGTNMTPASKHILDVDTRHMRTLDVAIETLAAAIEMAAQKHKNITVSVIQGNHDRDAYLSVLFALGERYRSVRTIDVQRNPSEFFIYEFGKVMIAAHHGDKAKAERLVMHMADEWPEIWGRTRHRFYFTGHLHHLKMLDVGGVQVEQLRAVTARDAYAASHAYSSRSQMQAITYDRDAGEISRVKVSL